ncbi:hypothetical protein SAMN05421505_120115 [Sinosporangium album]|uniref:Uncharacterized protein n=1 Tax=Sinosporangium album TaxID=504805 RepID=A0A1G8EIE3_9ACTN|nr:hypothetical protein [Sinosporangium album]SDH69674.1 hypothetical protein SAMN05421505_120115 [Sinosporangium album]
MSTGFDPDRVHWHTLAFTPAPPGWLLLFLDPSMPEGYSTMPMPGWLTQQAWSLDPGSGAVTPRPHGEVRVVAAAMDHGVVEPAEQTVNFWRALAPPFEPPDPDEVASELAVYKQGRV